MATKKVRFENMLFNFETTQRSDYRDGKITPTIETKYKERKRCLMTRPPPLKDIHTLTDWRRPVSFGLILKPKYTDPSIAQAPYSPPTDPERELVQMTRPRIVMTPAVSMDDIEDRQSRNTLCEAMYTSDMTRATREAVSDYFSVRAPVRDHPAPANPIWLRKYKEPVVPPEWRMESMKMDYDLLRSHCEPTKEFWMRRPDPVCTKCKESNIVTSNRRKLDQMKRGR